MDGVCGAADEAVPWREPAIAAPRSYNVSSPNHTERSKSNAHCLRPNVSPPQGLWSSSLESRA
jgi:hypothetical protein